MAPTGSVINKQYVIIPNWLYNLITWVLTEDQSARPISNLKDEMSEATDRRILSFAHDIIYDVTRGKVENPETCRSGCTVEKFYWFSRSS
jgi:hypothetical protein